MAKPSSSSRSGKQQVRDPIRGGQLTAVADPHAPAIDTPASRAHQERSLLAHQPGAELTALEHQPGRRGQLALGMADEVAEQSERDPLGAGIRAQAPPGAALAADRNHLASAAARLKPGHRPGVGEGRSPPPGTSTARSRSAAPPGPLKINTTHTVHAVQRRPSRRRVRSLASSRQ